jgi:hypothetical protein
MIFWKAPNTHLHIKQKEIKQFKKIKSYISYGSPCDSTCILMGAKIFLMNHHVWIMHINLCHDFFIE